MTSYQYNGLGDRLTQNGVHYTLDLNAGLTQVLSDGENSYMYGLGRISQTNTTTEYFLGDALGSVRQLTDSTGEITLVNTYEPYGNSATTFGTGESTYGFTGETTDANGLIYLRARYYNPADARFISRDTWAGDVNNPLSLNRWMYVEGNPVNLIDSTGLKPGACQLQGGGRYCILKKGGLIDMNHYRGGRNLAKELLRKLSDRERWGKDDEPLDIDQDLFGPIPYLLVYRTSIPKDGFPDGYQIINRVALGIFMDFQIRFENFQGLDPRCHNQALEEILVPVFDGYCSSYATEDLLSDYLGFIDFIRDDISFGSIIASLGGGYASSKHPLGYFPKNYSFSTIKYVTIDKCHEMTFVNRRIPASWRNLLPFEPGRYWDVPRGSGRIDLFPWL